MAGVAETVRDLYAILLKHGGKVRHVAKIGGIYQVTTVRSVTYYNSLTPSEYLERMNLRPCTRTLKEYTKTC